MKEKIPVEVHELCKFWSPIEKVLVTEGNGEPWACSVWTLGLELRFVKVIDGTWEWDEIVGPCRVHVEMMDTNQYWIGFEGDGGRVCVDIGAKRAPVRMTGWTE